MTREQAVAALCEKKVKRDLAVQYVDAWMEYREASANIEKNGVLVTHPRTGTPMVNPYLGVRDGALKKLQSMRSVPAAVLW